MFLTLCIAMLSMTLVQAQEKTYSGTVKSAADGQVIIGANVAVVGTTQGTSTGVDGTYSIKARVGSQLTFSYLGMKSQTITVGNTTTINVTLESDATNLDEIVVTGFGNTRKRDLTGSVSSIDSKIISSQANSTLTKALEGSIPGLQVSSIDGQPGLDMGMRIRGIGTASQNNANALIVIDGVPTTNSNALTMLNPRDVESMTVLKDAASTALWGARGANGVIMVTTKKGAQGKAKVTFDAKWGINMIGSNGRPDLIRDPKDIYELTWEGIYNSVRYGSEKPYTTNFSNPNMSHEEAALFASQHLFNYTGSQTTFNSVNNLTNWMYYEVPGAVYTPTGTGTSASATMSGAYLVDPNTGKLNTAAKKLYDPDDWEDIAYQNAFRQEYTATVSGATDKTDYYLSAGWLDDPSYIQGSIFNRYTLRSNINTQVTKWLQAGLNIGYSRRATQSPATRYGRNPGTTVQNVFQWVNLYMPLASYYARDAKGNYVYDENGDRVVVEGPGIQYSPLNPDGSAVLGRYPVTSTSNHYDLKYQLANDKDETIYNDLNMRGYVKATFLKDFTFEANLAVDNTWAMRERYVSGMHGAAVSEKGAMGRAYSDYQNINSQQMLTWNHDFGKHHVDVLLGHEFNWMRTSSLNYKAAYGLIEGFDTFTNFIFYNSGSTFSGIGGGEDQEALEGYFLRANYNFNNKYFLTASVRADGSSKFRYNEDRWGVFWSVGGAWRINTEPWMESASWVNDLKLRADYGVIGNQNGISRYSGYQTWGYSATGYTTVGSYSPAGWKLAQNSYTNPLTWEKKKTVDVGLDFRLWDRFYGTLDWYQTITDDMAWNAPISYAMSGQTTLAANSAKMRSRGFELSLGVDIIKTADLLWSFNVNGATYFTTLLEVPEGTGSDELNGCWTAAADGWSAVGAGGTSNMITYLRGIGKPYYNMYIYEYGGVDKTTGLPLFASTVSDDNIAALQSTTGTVVGTIAEGNKVYTTDYSLATRQEFGDATPDFMGGFGTSLTWKNLDFSAQFAFQIGGKFLSVSDANHYYRTEELAYYHTAADVIGNVFNASNTGAKYPMIMLNNPNGNSYTGGSTIGSWAYTDMALYSASYLSVKNITIGYNFPQKWMDKIGIGGIRVYASLDNFWMLTTHPGIDPRMSLVGGMDVGAMAYPYMRTCSLGVNVTF